MDKEMTVLKGKIHPISERAIALFKEKYNFDWNLPWEFTVRTSIHSCPLGGEVVVDGAVIGEPYWRTTTATFDYNYVKSLVDSEKLECIWS